MNHNCLIQVLHQDHPLELIYLRSLSLLTNLRTNPCPHHCQNQPSLQSGNNQRQDLKPRHLHHRQIQLRFLTQPPHHQKPVSHPPPQLQSQRHTQFKVCQHQFLVRTTVFRQHITTPTTHITILLHLDIINQLLTSVSLPLVTHQHLLTMLDILLLLIPLMQLMAKLISMMIG